MILIDFKIERNKEIEKTLKNNGKKKVKTPVTNVTSFMGLFQGGPKNG